MPKKNNVLSHHTAIGHKMNMALQKFAHGTTHYCKFKRTALCENAFHYHNKSPSTSKFYLDFKNIFFQRSKNWNKPFYLQMFCALSGRSLSWNTPVFSRFTSREHAKLHRLPFFSHSCVSSSFKGAAPKVLWEKFISRRSKELKSNPKSYPLVWAPCLKFGWRHHISSSGCSSDCLVRDGNKTSLKCQWIKRFKASHGQSFSLLPTAITIWQPKLQGVTSETIFTVAKLTFEICDFFTINWLFAVC